MTTKPKLYKVLSADGKPCNGGTGEWFLPHGKRPGKWMPPIKGELCPCENGYHLCRLEDLLQWIGPRVFEAQTRGEKITATDKIVVREARLLKETGWNERTARLFACDCAEHVLPIFEKKYPQDKRAREAIATARKFANGKATKAALAAARDAAWDAAWDAARDAASSPWAAARDAAWATAGDAAWDATRDAEQKWQLRRLFHYLK